MGWGARLEGVFVYIIRTLRNYDGVNEQNNISLLSLDNHDLKWSNFKFTWERERQDDKFYHLCLARSPLFSSSLNALLLAQQGELG